MVVFTCNHCGDSLQKPRVEKHYQTTCRRNPISVSCMDCFKDFRGEEYVDHTKCISEAERYSGKGFTPKPGQNKGEKKQMAWIDTVNSVLQNSKDITFAERFLLSELGKSPNVPRKKPKFLNYIKNVLRNKVDMPTVDSVWEKLETAQKEQQAQVPEPKTILDNSVKQNEKSMQNGNHSLTEINNSEVNDETLSKKERKEKRKREKYESEIKEVENTAPFDENAVIEDDESNNKPKKKKRKQTSEAENSQNVENIKSNKKFESNSEEATNKRNIGEITKTIDESADTKFNWEKVIKDILESKDNELSIKKLRKKVLAEYTSFKQVDNYSEKTLAKFNKKITNIKGIKLDKEKAFLIKE